MKPVPWTLLLLLVPFAIFGDYYDDGCIAEIISTVQPVCGQQAGVLTFWTGIGSILVVGLILIYGFVQKRKHSSN